MIKPEREQGGLTTISNQKGVFIMLFAILSLIIIFAEMYFTRDTAFFYSPDKPCYDYR